MSIAQQEYPNREHRNADQSARRRALAALDKLGTDALAIARRIETPGACPDASDGRRLAESAGRVIEHLSALETLRDVREWHAADKDVHDSHTVTDDHEHH